MSWAPPKNVPSGGASRASTWPGALTAMPSAPLGLSPPSSRALTNNPDQRPGDKDSQHLLGSKTAFCRYKHLVSLCVRRYDAFPTARLWGSCHCSRIVFKKVSHDKSHCFSAQGQKGDRCGFRCCAQCECRAQAGCSTCKEVAHFERPVFACRLAPPLCGRGGLFHRRAAGLPGALAG